MSQPASQRPDPAVDLHSETTIGQITLEWKGEPYEPLVDHYAVYAARDEDVTPDETTLLAKTIYPRFAHSLLGGDAQTWNYRVVVVDAAGNRSHPTEQLTETSAPSVATIGTPLTTLGEFDHKSLELALAPNGYADYTTRFPDGPDFTAGVDDPGTDWSYIHPGPADSWAGGQSWLATYRFQLDEIPAGDLWLSVWLLDTHATVPGTADIRIGGQQLAEVEFEGGATRGSLEGDATLPDSPLQPSYVELEVPRSYLSTGENILTIDKIDGSWHVYDALGVFLVE